MADVNTALDANRRAVEDLIAAAEGCGDGWTTPRAPGKWAPCQVVEHVALSLEESANVVSGAPSRFPTIPRLARPLVRGLLFNRVLRKQAFPKARTVKAFDPPSGPATPGEGRLRLETAAGKFDRECRARAADGEAVHSLVFGDVPLADYVRFEELHTRHHLKQMPGRA